MEGELYEVASQHFLLKDFSKSLEALTRESLQPSLRPYLLYLALCDQAFSAPDNSDWPLNEPSRKQLRNSVLKSDFWTDLGDKWEPTGEPVPDAIIKTGFTLASKYKGDPAPIIAFVELYLSQQPLPQTLFLAFVTDILVTLQHDFYYARELVKTQLEDDEVTQTQILKLIDQEETEFRALQLREKQALEELEKERVRQAIAEAEKLEREKATFEESSRDGTPDTIVNEKENAIIKKDSTIRRQPYTRRSIVDYWKKWLHDFLRSQGLYNTLILLFMLLAVNSSPRAKRFLEKARIWCWQTIKASLAMGLKVTYL